MLVGNKAYSSQRLMQVIKSGQTNILSFLLKNDLYDPDRIEVDRSQLRRFYLSHGYPDIRIVSAETTYDPERKGFVVTYTIDEGQRHRIGTVDVKSDIPSIDASPISRPSCAVRARSANKRSRFFKPCHKSARLLSAAATCMRSPRDSASAINCWKLRSA